MPRRNRNALDFRAMSQIERQRYLDSKRDTDYRDLKRDLDKPWCFNCCSRNHPTEECEQWSGAW